MCRESAVDIAHTVLRLLLTCMSADVAARALFCGICPMTRCFRITLDQLYCLLPGHDMATDMSFWLCRSQEVPSTTSCSTLAHSLCSPRAHYLWPWLPN